MADSLRESPMPGGYPGSGPPSPEASETLTPNNDVAADGDLYLDLWDGTKSLRLRVDSVILGNASTVLQALLASQLSDEQQLLPQSRLKTIPLHVGDVAAMTKLCHVLHSENDPRDPSLIHSSIDAGAAEFLQLAQAADKYACTEAINASSTHLLVFFAGAYVPRETSFTTLLTLVSATDLLNDRNHFAFFTRCLILDSSTSAEPCGSPRLDNLIEMG